MRLGIATGKGHAAMIYQRFGKWWGLFSLVDLQLVNFLTLVTEFAAIALALEQDGRGSRAMACRMAAVAPDVPGGDGQLPALGANVVFLCLLDLAWFAIAFRSVRQSGQVVRHTWSLHAGGRD